MTSQKYPLLSFRISKPLKDLTKKFVARGAHLNVGEFCRDAIREKIQKDAPELYGTLFTIEAEAHE